ncbi:hypothetical protein BOTBODRAFT_170905 [Botryobasidium botryosum FD-172 SS1]|uniref:Uncharacterized protein n=1 Tax=Botryobasidium botryosum (strain FD-172 SS1) TaxID=930990 RepID=A0A067MW51_BOTB1|nr:hypothetical protein BOTBODRAFT_170905 [Botryobasidium botryosum FD-172 SS1]
MPPPLQVLTMGCAIIAPRAFWLKPGELMSLQEIRASAEHYIQSQTAEHVKTAILEAFQDVDGSYDTPQHREALLSIILSNQICRSSAL